MRLQKQLSRKVGSKEYPKYVIVVPPKLIKKLEWKDKEELKAEVRDGELVVKKNL